MAFPLDKHVDRVNLSAGPWVKRPLETTSCALLTLLQSFQLF